MFSKEFINNFSTLGLRLLNWATNNSSEPLIDRAISSSESVNPLFTPYMQRNSIVTIAKFYLDKESLSAWLANYHLSNNNELNILINSAGNIPLVAFQDFLCTLATGNVAIIKLSSKDKFLLPALIEILFEINPIWRSKIKVIYNLDDAKNYNIDSVISMGSDDTVKLLDRMFPNIPKLLRGHMFSFAVVSGSETKAELDLLAKDILLYFGMGCRSVSYLLVPDKYNFDNLVDAFNDYKTLLNVDCFINSYKRERAVAFMESQEVVDTGSFLFKYTDSVNNSTAVVGVKRYYTGKDIEEFEINNSNNIQKKYCNFGAAQSPLLNEYPNGVDVIEFILKLKN